MVAVAASLLTAAYFIIRDQVPYRDPGSHYFEGRDREWAARRLARRIQALGYTVQLAAA